MFWNTIEDVEYKQPPVEETLLEKVTRLRAEAESLKFQNGVETVTQALIEHGSASCRNDEVVEHFKKEGFWTKFHPEDFELGRYLSITEIRVEEP